IAFVRVAVPLVQMHERLAALSHLIWTAVGVTASVALVLSFWLARRTARPLRELIAAADRIAAGDYGQKVYLAGKDEGATLAETFNRMSLSLAAGFTQLEEDRQQLRTILSSMVEGVIALDADQRIVFANDRAGQLLEFRIKTSVGRKLWEVVRVHSL